MTDTTKPSHLMKDLRSRLEGLPEALLDGRWTHCAVSAEDRRAFFVEPAGDVARRRLLRLRRKGLQAGAGLVALALVPFLTGTVQQTVVAIVASVLLLAALDGLGSVLRREERPFEYAMIDAGRDELTVRRPGGDVLRVGLGDVRMFVVVVDRIHRVFHLVLVLRDRVEGDVFLPWMHTPSESAANSLCWLFGHLTEIPAMSLDAGFPVSTEDLAQATPLAFPSEPERGGG